MSADRHYMHLAFEQAQRSYDEGGLPIGAVMARIRVHLVPGDTRPVERFRGDVGVSVVIDYAPEAPFGLRVLALRELDPAEAEHELRDEFRHGEGTPRPCAAPRRPGPASG